MKFTYVIKNCKINETTKEVIEKKFSKLGRFFGEDAEIAINLSEDKKFNKILEANCEFNGIVFRSEAKTAEFISSAQLVVDTIISQLRKNKTRIEKQIKGSSIDFSNMLFTDTVVDEYEDIIKVKHFNIKPMDEEEAILQMNMLGHKFFVFPNSHDNNRINVLYLRDNGGYGLIMPTLK